MSHPTQQHGGDEHTKSALTFTTIMTLFAGGAGLVVAGLILGFDYLLHGHPDEREEIAEERAERRRDRYADALSWLDADRTDRDRYRQATREWFEKDPATRGDKPDSGESAGRVAARMWNWCIVGWRRFKDGWDAGREEARERRENGDDGWWWGNGKRDKDRDDTGEDDQTGGDDRGDSGEQTDWGKPDPEPRPGRDDNEPIDAEIIPDPHAADRELVPVGQDETPAPDPRTASYDARLADLEAEIASEPRAGYRDGRELRDADA